MVFRTNEIIFRTNEIIFRTNEIIFRTNEILFRTNEIKKITTLNVPLWAPYVSLPLHVYHTSDTHQRASQYTPTSSIT